MPAVRQITRGEDGARVLIRFARSANDSFALEATVREFSRDAAWVRLARSAYKTDRGGWLRVADLILVDVLEAQCALKDRPTPTKKRKGKRIEGDEWKDADSSGDLPFDEEGDE